MADNLHLFKDIHISKTYKLARLIDGAMYFQTSIKRNPALFACFFSAVIFLSITLAKILTVISGSNVSFLLFFVTAQAVFILFSLVSFKIAKKICERFKNKLDIGIRDSWLFLSVFNICVICVFPVGDNRSILTRIIIAAVLIAVSLKVVAGYYEKKIAVKRQPDLDIPMDQEADEEFDFEFIGDAERKKVQIAGDTRNAFLLKDGEEVRLTLKEHAGRIKFAIGVRESLRDSFSKDTTLKVYQENNKGSLDLLYTKKIDPITDHNARGWIDIAVEVKPVPKGVKRNILVRCEGDKKSEKRYCCFSGPRLSGKTDPRKIILIVIDAVRYDQLGCYGYNKDLSSNIDALAQDGTVFSNAIVQGEWTLPSFMSILSGLYPSTHHVYHHTRYHTLDKKFPTLTQILRKNGFITRNYFTHKRLMSHFGFARGFDSHIFRQCNKEWNIATADDVTDRAIDMLSFHADDDLFLMLHYFDTHQPCDPPSPYSEMFDKFYEKKIKKNVRQMLMDKKNEVFDKKDLDNLIARYKAEIYRVNVKAGMIIDYLKKMNQYDESMVIITADHGMLLGDHGSMTEITLFDETVKVPLIIKYPSSLNCGKGNMSDVVSEANLDLMPTILDSFGIEKPQHLQGKSLYPKKEMIFSAEEPRKEYAISESLFNNSYTVSLRDKHYRYIFKTHFDISDFANYAENNTEKAVFKVNEPSPEIEIEGKEADELIKKYDLSVSKHINDMLKMHNRK